MRWFLSLLVLTLSACVDAAPPDGRSGLEGLVTVGPQCPVVQGESCPDLPYAATLELQQAGILLVRFQADAQGKFRVAVRPGSYSLEPLSPPGRALPAARPQAVTVLEGQFLQVAVVYDSGIR
jgi:hypothetical protein